MSNESKTYGGQLYAELRTKSGYDVITSLMDYHAIQQLKVADREQTLKLFRESSDEVIQILRTAEPTEAAGFLIEKTKQAQEQMPTTTSTAWFIISSI